MAANYLHGPETIEVENGARPVKTVKSAVIGLIGTAPMGDVNTLVQCLSEKDAAAFGSQFTGFTIPQALDAIYDHGAGTVLVINVLDPAKHKTAIEDEVVTFDKSTGQARLAHPVVANVVVKNSEGSTTHTANTDYRVDAQAGVLTNLGKAIEAGGSVKVSYEYADPSKVTAADIIGGVNSAGNRTGMKLLNDSFNLYGYFAKILIAPVFCTQKSVAVELIAMAEKLGAVTYIDAPVGTTFAQALAPSATSPSAAPSPGSPRPAPSTPTRQAEPQGRASAAAKPRDGERPDWHRLCGAEPPWRGLQGQLLQSQHPRGGQSKRRKPRRPQRERRHQLYSEGAEVI